jgi:hypothetical protein
VDPHARQVTLDGEPIAAAAVERVAFSGSYLLG